jgi:N-acyl homoserine lactone hydrolase
MPSTLRVTGKVKSNWESRRVPSLNTDKDQTLASMQRIADLLVK